MLEHLSGRGIPEDDIPMEILCTKLNSGSKMTREQAEKFVAKMQATDTLKQVDSILNNFSGGI